MMATYSSPSTPKLPRQNSDAATPTPHRGAPASLDRSGMLWPDGRAKGTDGKKGATAEQRRSRREQLRNFYGIKGDAAKGGGNALDIDSPSFNAAIYYEDIISKSTLGGLMKTASALSSDIGNLEGSRHSLVYNHHHQLFAAGDTISHLNSRTPQLLSIVTSLQQSFSSISQLADSVALYETAPASGKGSKEGRVSGKQRTVALGEKRLILMVEANETPNKVRSLYKTFEAELEELADSDEAEKLRLRRCRALLDGLPETEEPAVI